MAVGIGRRQFMSALGSVAATWPLAARAQQPVMPVIGLLNSISPEAAETRMNAFRRGLGEGGFVQGRNVAFEFRWANGKYDLLPALAADLVARKVDVIFASGGPPATLAAAAATNTIPIVFISGVNPVTAGIAKSFNHPAGNATGFMLFTVAGWTKRLELAAQIAEKDSAVGVLLNPKNPKADPSVEEMQQAAQAQGRKLAFVSASTTGEIEMGLESLANARVGAAIISPDPFFVEQTVLIVTRALQHKLPIVCEWSDEAKAGGLMSYGIDLLDDYHQAGVYTARLLKGERPSDLPIVQPTKFEFVINLKTAKALGLTIRPTLLAIADEVIE